VRIPELPLQFGDPVKPIRGDPRHQLGFELPRERGDGIGIGRIEATGNLSTDTPDHVR
jgi:hypothetical protein